MRDTDNCRYACQSAVQSVVICWYTTNKTTSWKPGILSGCVEQFAIGHSDCISCGYFQESAKDTTLFKLSHYP